MLTDSKEEAAVDVLLFLREAVHKFDQLRAAVIGRLLDSLSALKSPKYEYILWTCICNKYSIISYNYIYLLHSFNLFVFIN